MVEQVKKVQIHQLAADEIGPDDILDIVELKADKKEVTRLS